MRVLLRREILYRQTADMEYPAVQRVPIQPPIQRDEWRREDYLMAAAIILIILMLGTVFLELAIITESIKI